MQHVSCPPTDLQVAVLERLRADRLRRSAVLIQARVRGWCALRRYCRVKRAAQGLQCRARGALARWLATSLRRTRAALCIQRRVRGWLCRTRYHRTMRAILSLQCCARALVARDLRRQLQHTRMATRLQAAVRRMIAQRRFRRIIKAVVMIQCGVRRLRARRMLKQLRVEARSVEGIQKKNYALEMKIVELQQKLDARAMEAREGHGRTVSQFEQRVSELQGKLNKESESANDLVQRLEAENASLRAALDQAHAQRDDMRAMMARTQQERDARLAELTVQVREHAVVHVRSELVFVQSVHMYILMCMVAFGLFILPQSPGSWTRP